MKRLQALATLLDGAPPSHVLFDLDGTLVDSVPDLATATDAMLTELGRAPAGIDKVRTWVGNGTPMLVRRALADTLDDQAAKAIPAALFEPALAAFLAAYARCNGDLSQVYKGVADCLAAMTEAGVRLAVVTNKPAAFTAPLLERLDLSRWFTAMVSGDTLAVKKPDPAPLFHALDLLGGPVTRALLVGDSETDVATARAAGISCVAVRYGYNHGRPIDEAGAALVVDSLTELL